mgnify:CR=1 FL=1
MLLDKILFEKLGGVGQHLLNKANLNFAPSSTDEMSLFLNALKRSIKEQEFEGVLLGNILFHFVTSVEVRDRQVTSRIFEDIFASLFSSKSTDRGVRRNPVSEDEILALDYLCNNEDWKISQDLQGNKREKSDVKLGEYEISLKTLKGYIYDKDGKVVERKQNDELNVGSLSFRALLKGILTDDQISNLRDRKGGLGSARQVRASMLNPIIDLNKQTEFLNRLKLFINYVYTEDVIIVLKSHYNIKFILIPSDSFTNVITELYEKEEENFTDIWYRWENNNLRLRWVAMLKHMKKFNLPYQEISINLGTSIDNNEVNDFISKVSESIQENLDLFIK